MIRSVTIINHLNESIELNLFRPELSGLLIENITGLGPVKSDVNFTELATNDGAIANSSRLNSRDITMKLIFYGDDIEEIRLRTYKYFPIKRTITFIIETDNRYCYTTGVIESNEPNIFDKREGCTISIRCPSPYFFSLDDGDLDTVIFYGTEPLFEFPFDNNSVTESLIEFGNILTRTEGVITYNGDSEIGVVISIHSMGEAKGLIIYNTGTREFFSINDDRLIDLMGEGIKAGDDIIINTIKGSKSITLLRDGVYTNILNAMGSGSSWFQLVKGDNVFAYTASAGLNNLQFKIETQTIYEGV